MWRLSYSDGILNYSILGNRESVFSVLSIISSYDGLREGKGQSTTFRDVRLFNKQGVELDTETLDPM